MLFVTLEDETCHCHLCHKLHILHFDLPLSEYNKPKMTVLAKMNFHEFHEHLLNLYLRFMVSTGGIG